MMRSDEWIWRKAIYLKSEHGENPEYDRALVEMATEITGLCIKTSCDTIGVDHDKIYPKRATT